ncbi:hypothetical protein ABFV99_13935 [Cytobacillus horneckiae]|uniref:hypothetical protein n=1 Tax=Cytobacillus horneckiae TaxID=549687 RepID=UPI0034CD0715
MPASVAFPVCFMNQSIYDEMSEHYDFDYTFEEFEEQYDNGEIDDIIDAAIDYICGNYDDIDVENAILYVLDEHRYGDDTIRWLEHELESHKIPYDSIQANELFIHKYRPDSEATEFDFYIHPNIAGPLFPIEKLMKILDSTTTNDANTLKSIIMKNIEKECYPVPELSTFTQNLRLHQYSELEAIRLSI